MKTQIEDYKQFMDKKSYDDMVRLIDMFDRSINHISATRVGGGVAEILNRMIPLMQSSGIDCDWNVTEGNEAYYNVTKSFHNMLHDQSVKPQMRYTEMFDIFKVCNDYNCDNIATDYDCNFIHDPQPIGMINDQWDGHENWVWRCHIDVSNPNPIIWSFLNDYLQYYDTAVYSMEHFTPINSGVSKNIIRPSIDPLSDKNIELSEDEIDKVLDKYDIIRDKPTIVQVSRFDRLKDMPATLKSYKNVKKNIDCQLIIAGGVASDDPEGMEVYNEIVELVGNDQNVHLLLGNPPFTDIEINAFQRAGDVIVQKSLKEGFGLVISEAMWKKKPVVGGKTGGIPAQIRHGKTGYLAIDTDNLSRHVEYLLKNPNVAKLMGEKGHDHVKNNFLIFHEMMNYLKLC